MKRYHSQTFLYLHETIGLGAGRSDRFSGDERSREERCSGDERSREERFSGDERSREEQFSGDERSREEQFSGDERSREEQFSGDERSREEQFSGDERSREEQFSGDERSREEQFTEVFSDLYQPMMEALGARLFAIWETTPYNGHWPQVTIIWEIDAFADYARIGAALARGGSHEAAAGKWSAFLADIGASGEGRIMYPGPSHKTLAQLRDANFNAAVVI